MTVDLAVSPGGRPADASPIGKPGGRQNWVDKTGGLPKYLRMIAHALLRKNPTWDASHAIAVAKNRLERLAATSKNPKVKAAAMAALAEWAAKLARSHAKSAVNLADPGTVFLDLARLADDDVVTLLEAGDLPVLDLAPGNYRPPYDWKHGYIPITPAAALSKAKGNKKRASKLLRGGARPSPRMAKQLEGARKSAPKVAPKLDQHGFPERPSDPPEVELRRLNNYLAGRAGGTASDADVARWRKRKTELEARVAKAQDDANRGRGVPGELAAAKKAVGPSDAEKIRNAATMHGAGSKQHLEAQRRFGGKPAAKKTAAPKPDKNGFPDNGPKKPADMTAPEIVAEQERLSNYISGRAGGTATKADVDRWQVRRRELETERQKRVRDAMRSHPDRQTAAPKPDKSPVSSTGGSVSAPKGASKSTGAGDGSPRLSGDTVRRMSDDQLDGALSRLMAAGGKDSHALSLIEKEMDRRDKAKASPLAAVGSTMSVPNADVQVGDVVHVAGLKGARRLRVDKAYAMKSDGTRNVDVTDVDRGTSTTIALEPHKNQKVERKRGGSPKGDTPGTGDTGLDDLTFKADRQSHKFTDDIVSRMSQPQLERSLGTLLSAGYDNDAPVVRKLTGALEAKDPEAAKVYRKGADRTAQDAKAALRFAHGTREQQKADYHAYVEHLAHQAEASDMVGAHALSRASRNGTVRLPDLWSMTPAQIRKHASPELLEWFSKPGNEPLPFDAWRAAHLGATDRRAVDSLRRRREQWLSEYG